MYKFNDMDGSKHPLRGKYDTCRSKAQRLKNSKSARQSDDSKEQVAMCGMTASLAVVQPNSQSRISGFRPVAAV